MLLIWYLVVFPISFRSCRLWLKFIDGSNIKGSVQYVALIYSAFDLLLCLSNVKISDGPRVEVGSWPGREMRTGNRFRCATSRPVKAKHVGHPDIIR